MTGNLAKIYSENMIEFEDFTWKTKINLLRKYYWYLKGKLAKRFYVDWKKNPSCLVTPIEQPRGYYTTFNEHNSFFPEAVLLTLHLSFNNSRMMPWILLTNNFPALLLPLISYHYLPLLLALCPWLTVIDHWRC